MTARSSTAAIYKLAKEIFRFGSREEIWYTSNPSDLTVHVILREVTALKCCSQVLTEFKDILFCSNNVFIIFTPTTLRLTTVYFATSEPPERITTS